MDAASNPYITGSTTADENFPIKPSTLNPGGVFRSDNGAANWAGSSTGLDSIVATALAFDPSAPARMYAGTSRGIFWSEDGGDHWSRRITVSHPGIVSPAIVVGVEILPVLPMVTTCIPFSALKVRQTT